MNGWDMLLQNALGIRGRIFQGKNKPELLLEGLNDTREQYSGGTSAAGQDITAHNPYALCP
jgi:hypothetical protein